VENLPRILPEGHGMVLRRDSWTVPRVFPWLQALGSVETGEMDRVFNMGIGLVIVVAEHFAEAIVRRLSRRLKIPCWIIGEVVPGERTVSWQG
jgi:phosphoribosylformylglycinamidine cyclo-ligase